MVLSVVLARLWVGDVAREDLRERLAVPGVVGPEGDHHLARGQRPLLMRVHDEALPVEAVVAHVASEVQVFLRIVDAEHKRRRCLHAGQVSLVVATAAAHSVGE